MSAQDQPLVATRDIFLCPAVAFVVFILAQKVGYYSNWLLGVVLVLIAPVVCAFAGAKIRRRPIGALNAYSVATAFGALIFVLKWWPEL